MSERNRRDRARNAYWCEKCHVPLIGTVCNICSQEGKPFTTKIKPVFADELNFLYLNRTSDIHEIKRENALFKSRNLFYGKEGAFYKVKTKANDKGIKCEFSLNGRAKSKKLMNF